MNSLLNALTTRKARRETGPASYTEILRTTPSAIESWRRTPPATPKTSHLIPEKHCTHSAEEDCAPLDSEQE